jgi:hypothetical protein
MSFDTRYQRFLDLMEAFVAGRDRSQRHVREMEGEFAQQFDEDERFEDLQYALAMFGADDYDMEDHLVKECAWAIRTLHGVCVYRDCRGATVEGSRFCAEHQPG